MLNVIDELDKTTRDVATSPAHRSVFVSLVETRAKYVPANSNKHGLTSGFAINRKPLYEDIANKKLQLVNSNDFHQP